METNSPVTQLALRYGTILGLTQIILTLCLYFANKELLVSFWVGLCLISISIGILVYTVKQLKQQLSEVTFKDVFLLCFISCVNAQVLTSLFEFVLYNFIDTELSTFIKEKVIEKTIGMMERFGAREEDIEKAVNDMNNQDYSKNLKNISKQFFMRAIFSAVPAVIIAAIMRTKTKHTDDLN